MTEILSTAFLLYTAVFAAYWTTSAALLLQDRGGELRFLEFMRLWIKPLFWMNLSYFVVVEITFSAVYWAGIATIRFSTWLTGWSWLTYPMEGMFRLVNGVRGEDPYVSLWLIISIVLFAVVMAPYSFVHRRLGLRFKQLAFRIASTSIGVRSAEVISQAPSKLLPSALVCQLVSSFPRPRRSIHSIFSRANSDRDPPRKFEINAHNSNHMSWDIADTSTEFWESEIAFDEQTINERGSGYDSDTTTYFDGIVLRVEDAMDEEWEPSLFRVENVHGVATDSRSRHGQQGFWMRVIDLLGRGLATHATSEDSTSTSYPAQIPHLDIELGGKVAFVGVDRRTLFLFVPTGFEGGGFELPMNVGVRESVAAFERELQRIADLALSTRHVVARLESWRDARDSGRHCPSTPCPDHSISDPGTDARSRPSEEEYKGGPRGSADQYTPA